METSAVEVKEVHPEVESAAEVATAITGDDSGRKYKLSDLIELGSQLVPSQAKYAYMEYTPSAELLSEVGRQTPTTPQSLSAVCSNGAALVGLANKEGITLPPLAHISWGRMSYFGALTPVGSEDLDAVEFIASHVDAPYDITLTPELYESLNIPDNLESREVGMTLGRAIDYYNYEHSFDEIVAKLREYGW